MCTSIYVYTCVFMYVCVSVYIYIYIYHNVSQRVTCLMFFVFGDSFLY